MAGQQTVALVQQGQDAADHHGHDDGPAQHRPVTRRTPDALDRRLGVSRLAGTEDERPSSACHPAAVLALSGIRVAEARDSVC